MSAPYLSSAMPGLAVADLDRAVVFYTEKLGFSVSFINGKAYAVVRRDNVEIGLGLDHSERNAGHGSCYVKLKGIDAIHGELSAKRVPMTHDLRNESYGMREFMITDPDGNTINFGEPIP